MSNKNPSDNSRPPRNPSVPPPPPPPARRSSDGQTPRRLPSPPARKPEADGDLPGQPVPSLPPFRPRRTLFTLPTEQPPSSEQRKLPWPRGHRPSDNRSEIEPPTSLERPWWRSENPPFLGPDRTLDVPMICARFDRGFVLVFRPYGGGGSEEHYSFSSISTMSEVGSGTTAFSWTVPITSLHWSFINCPHCNALCRPIQCGRCERLVCDGQVTNMANGEHFRCTPSCGMAGFRAAKLEKINGTSRQELHSLVPARPLISAPETPAPNVPRLPKPR